MQVTQRKIQARVVAETEAASSILREHLPDLRSRLESFGMQIEQIEIETESQERQAEFSWNRHEQEQRDQRHRQSQNSRQRAEPPTHTQTVTEPVERATHDPRRAAVAGVDIRL